ncbi:MAG TPA: TIR domain-containing protein [Thermoanaerobaculia bacterium]|nr:TIR domain-containing protein [Thermoanaerobaculia bacterium]
MRTFFSFLLRQDKDLVISLANELQAFGYYPTIPIDRHIRVHHWRSRLVEALRKSDVAVVLLSPESLKYSYVMGELYAARLLSQVNRRFVLVPVLCGTSEIPDIVRDLYVANAKGGEITDPRKVALEIDEIVRDNLEFELAISDLTPRVFIGHGHSADWKRVAAFLQDELKLEVEEYSKRSPAGKTVLARLEEMLSVSSFAIIVMSAEDEQVGGDLRARQNVIHEVGLFQGRLGFEKAIVLRQQGCQAFSNISGLNEIQYDSGNWDEALDKIRLALEREGLVGRAVSVATGV